MYNEIGHEIGPYRLIRILGIGGFGTVYRAERISDQAPVAIKRLYLPVTSHDTKEAFVREVVAMLRTQTHPNIVPILDCGFTSADRFPFLVMPYYRAGTLAARHPQGSRVPLPDVVSYVAQVADALSFLHRRGFIHRDVKAANLLIGDNGSILLGDFGIVKILERSEGTTTRPIGTPSYVAPEQLEGHPVFASDQYVLAALAYEWLSGSPPFTGDRHSLMYQHVHCQPPSLPPYVPASVNAVIQRALSKNPKKRYPDVADMAAELVLAQRKSMSGNWIRLPTMTPPSQFQARDEQQSGPLKWEDHFRTKQKSIVASSRLVEKWPGGLIFLHGIFWLFFAFLLLTPLMGMVVVWHRWDQAFGFLALDLCFAGLLMLIPGEQARSNIIARWVTSGMLIMNLICGWAFTLFPLLTLTGSTIWSLPPSALLLIGGVGSAAIILVVTGLKLIESYTCVEVVRHWAGKRNPVMTRSLNPTRSSRFPQRAASRRTREVS